MCGDFKVPIFPSPVAHSSSCVVFGVLVSGGLVQTTPLNHPLINARKEERYIIIIINTTSAFPIFFQNNALRTANRGEVFKKIQASATQPEMKKKIIFNAIATATGNCFWNDACSLSAKK